jgi:hypothetical protein
MKKALFTVLVLLFISLSANGQDYKTSLGLRIGYPYGATVKHFLNKTNALEGILASSYQGLTVTGLYENEHWTGKYPGLNWYWGLGAHVGFWDPGANPHLDTSYEGAVIGVDGVLGLEYTFDDFPLNLSLDLLPTFNLIGDTSWGGIYGAFSARYVF